MLDTSQTYAQKITKNISTIALVMQLIYMLHIALVTTFPKFFLRLCGISSYDFPFDFIHFTGAVVNTVLFLIFYSILRNLIKTGKMLNGAFGIFLGVYSYIAYFVVDGFVSFLYSLRINALSTAIRTCSTATATIGENAAGATYLSRFYSFADVWLFAAIVLILIAYAVYIFDCKKPER